MNALITPPTLNGKRFHQSGHRFGELPFILISGTGRSGTTIVTKGIQKHSKVYSNGVESNIIHDLLSAGLRNCQMPSRRNQLILPLPRYEMEFRDLILRLRFPEEMNGIDEPLALSTFSSMNPTIAEFFEKLFPQVVWLVVVRNGIEVVASRVEHQTFGRFSFEENCLVWSRCVEMADYAHQSDRGVVLRHEELFDRDLIEQRLGGVFGKAGLDYQPRCGDFILRTRRHGTQTQGESDENSLDLGKRRDRWKYWTKDQRIQFNRICGTAMDSLGYEIPF